jgi:tripartite-type tricarboxylate transporter receptor subunit TctC
MIKGAAARCERSRRASALLDVPTTVEAGVPDSDFDFWIGTFVPKATPRDIVHAINAALRGALESTQTRGGLPAVGVEPMILTPEIILTPEEFDAHVAPEGHHCQGHC